MMRTGWQRIVAGAAVTAVAPLAVTLALGTAIAHADTYAERGGGGGGGGSHGGSGGGGSHGGSGGGGSVQHRPGWDNGGDYGARQDHVPNPRSWNSGERGEWQAICGSCR
jgi:hypothetical protein